MFEVQLVTQTVIHNDDTYIFNKTELHWTNMKRSFKKYKVTSLLKVVLDCCDRGDNSSSLRMFGFAA